MQLAEADQAAIRGAVEQQLQAFQRDDAIGAFAFASPDIQDQFGTADTFMTMVKTAYPAVYRPRSVIFSNIVAIPQGLRRNSEGTPAQKVMMMTPAGELVTALYLMEKQPDTSWKIQGCFLMPVEGKAR